MFLHIYVYGLYHFKTKYNRIRVLKGIHDKYSCGHKVKATDTIIHYIHECCRRSNGFMYNDEISNEIFTNFKFQLLPGRCIGIK